MCNALNGQPIYANSKFTLEKKTSRAFRLIKAVQINVHSVQWCETSQRLKQKPCEKQAPIQVPILSNLNKTNFFPNATKKQANSNKMSTTLEVLTFSAFARKNSCIVLVCINTFTYKSFIFIYLKNIYVCNSLTSDGTKFNTFLANFQTQRVILLLGSWNKLESVWRNIATFDTKNLKVNDTYLLEFVPTWKEEVFSLNNTFSLLGIFRKRLFQTLTTTPCHTCNS